MLAIASADESFIAGFWRELSEIHAIAGFRHFQSLGAALARNHPRLVIVDLNSSGCSDMRALRSLCEHYRDVPFIVVSSQANIQAELRFLRSGVRGLLQRNAPVDLYRPMVAAVLQGQMWFSRQAISLFLEERGLVRSPGSRNQARVGSLSKRELQVAKLVITGASNKLIADSLLITERTVKAHLSHIFLKLGINQRSELYTLQKDLLFLGCLAVIW